MVNLGSKEGITTPPGNAAYSAGKAAIKVLTEQLAHELLQVAGDRVTAHLLIPGYTWTPMNFPGMDAKRIAWASQDIIENRPALSRWHPDWKNQFDSWMKN